MTDIFDEFADVLRKKFNLALKKDKNRSKEPWKEFNMSWLLSRLDEERKEYLEAVGNIEKSKEAIDMAEFCMFLWKKHLDNLNLD